MARAAIVLPYEQITTLNPEESQTKRQLAAQCLGRLAHCIEMIGYLFVALPSILQSQNTVTTFLA